MSKRLFYKKLMNKIDRAIKAGYGITLTVYEAVEVREIIQSRKEKIELMENGGSNSVEIKRLKAELQKRDEIIKQFVQDADRLLQKATKELYPHEYMCNFCYNFARDDERLIEHSEDCPVFLHNALMERFNLLDRSTFDGKPPRKQA